ncbi:MAG: right-handed parallel beta-helix repeat-containing protein [Verrucomicrobiales bacterium]|nr:right-handed parallel beta-helix repeat-containing protein [Verrucomicrobiales bacterium]
MSKTLWQFVSALWLLGLSEGLAVERFVPQGGALSYPTIQSAINDSKVGDIVWVQPGLYQESITFRNVDITLTSMNPGDAEVVRTTVIQGDGTNSVIRFAKGQGPRTVLTGFTVRGGGGTVLFGYRVGGGIFCQESSPTIVANILEENRLGTDPESGLSMGGAIACWDASPRISRNILRNNGAGLGGGLASFRGKPQILDNWFHGNSAQSGGAAFLSSQGTFLNNTVHGNSPDNLRVDQTGLMANNIIANAAAGTGLTILENDLSWFRNNDVWQPDGTEILRGVLEGENTVLIPASAAGTNGNLSANPQFADAAAFDFRLTAGSPCINAGDLLGLRTIDELDLFGGPRIFALRVDLGASEFRGAHDFPPLANAGPDRRILLGTGSSVTLDGVDSVDPNDSPLSYSWFQMAGPPVTLLPTGSRAVFHPTALGEYTFGLRVNDGAQDSSADVVRIVVTNLPPIASAGLGQSFREVPEVLVLNGSHSLDPEQQPLTYHWRQTAGPSVELSAPQSPRPTFRPDGPGVYEFELTVRDAFADSPPDVVTYYLGRVPPVANAGTTRYAGRAKVTLDGSGSFAPNSDEPLEYAWTVVSGLPVTLSSATVANPVVTGFIQATTNREVVFELVVTAGGLRSAPSTVKMIIVPRWSNPPLTLINGPFKTNRPTIFGFGGGNCDIGYGMSEFTAGWLSRANVFTELYNRDARTSVNDPRYYGYGDQLIAILSGLAPAYDQPIQAIGYSTGCMVACDVAERLNIGYGDPRFYVNRVTLLDSGCSRDYGVNIQNLVSNRISGRMFWIENYYSQSTFKTGTLNAEFPVPPADHGTPNAWYTGSWTLGAAYQPAGFNNGVFAGAFFSVIGPGRNYQLETGQSEYYFGWDPPTSSSFTYPANRLVPMSPVLHPARLPGVVELIGPTHGTLAAAGQVTFSCQNTLNAARYQILIGPNARQVDRVAWEGDAPPSQALPGLPFPRTWWTIRVLDAHGTASWSDARFVVRDSDRDTLSDESELLTHHTDPENPDTDGDGQSDGNEVLEGTDPLRSDVGMQIAYQLESSGALRLRWHVDPGTRTCDLEYSATIEALSWQVITSIAAPAAGGELEHQVAAAANPGGFYRVRSHLAPASGSSGGGRLLRSPGGDVGEPVPGGPPHSR